MKRFDEAQVKFVVNLLQSQSFHDWHQDDLECHVHGDEDCKSREEIQVDVDHFLNSGT